MTNYNRQLSAPVQKRYMRHLLAAAVAVAVAGCSSFGSSGPSRGAVLDSANKPLANAVISVVPLTDELVCKERDDAFGSAV